MVFNIHGVGFLTYEALTNLDLPTIIATVVFGAFFIVLANALVDVGYACPQGSTRRLAADLPAAILADLLACTSLNAQ